MAQKIELAREVSGLNAQQILTKWIEQGDLATLLDPAPAPLRLIVTAMDALVQAARLTRHLDDRAARRREGRA